MMVLKTLNFTVAKVTIIRMVIIGSIDAKHCFILVTYKAVTAAATCAPLLSDRADVIT